MENICLLLPHTVTCCVRGGET